MKKNKLTVVLMTLILATFVSCALLDSSPLMQPGMVVTESTNIDENYEGDLAVYPREKLPIKLQEVFKGDLVVAPRELLKDESKFWISTDPEDYEEPDVQGAAVWGVFDIAKVLFPGLIGIEALLGLLIPRKRIHYTKMIKALNPAYGGTVDIKEAMISLARGIGVAHSSPESKEAFVGKNSETPVK